MPSRYADWMAQAERDLLHAQHALEAGDFEWVCFAAHQASEKALKSLFQNMGAQVIVGHSVRDMLAELRQNIAVAPRLVGQAHIPTRFRTRIPQGRPFNFTRRPRPGRLSTMRISSSGSVKVIYLDRQRVIAGVKRAVARLTQAHREIKKVVLFGSLARGDVVPGSDADLLIVLSESAHPFLERISLYTPAKVPLSVDVFPYTEKELARMVADGNHFIKTALSEGLTLFVRKETRK